MKSKILNISIFILNVICLLISLKLFWNIAIYVDEFNTSPDVVLGGSLWLTMDCIRLWALILLCILSGIRLLKKK